MRHHSILSTIARAPGRGRVAVALACAIAGGAFLSPKTATANELAFLRCIPPYAAAVVVTSPKKLIENPAFELMPTEVFVAASLQEFGIDVSEIEQAAAIIAPPRLDGQPTVGFVLRFANPYVQDRAFASLQTDTQPAESNGAPYLRAKNAAGLSLFFADDQTILLAPESLLKGMMVKNTEGKLRKRIEDHGLKANATAFVSIDAIRPLAAIALSQLPPMPPPFGDLIQRMIALESAVLDVSIDDGFAINLALQCKSEGDARELERLMGQALDVGKQIALAQMEQGMTGDPGPIRDAMMSYQNRLAEHYAAQLKPRRDKDQVSLRLESDSTTAVVGVSTAMLLPAVTAAREAARRTQSMNNLKQIALAFHNYHDTYGAFPPSAIKNKEGRAVLSWRVAILPFINEAALYDQFNLEEPWDSPHNLKLAERMPEIFQNPSMSKGTVTNYLAPIGRDTVVSPDGTKIRDIRDGTSNTIMVVEANEEEAVFWTKPDDLEIDVQNPLRGLGTIRNDSFLATFADGSVRTISQHVDKGVMNALFTKSGGEVIPNL